MSFFITGTNTNVGKTVVSSCIVNFLQKNYPSRQTLFVKPIQTGNYIGDCDITTVYSKLNQSCEIKKAKKVQLANMGYACSPHLAAQLESYQPEITQKTLDTYAKVLKNSSKTHSLVIEGAGGLLVPITAKKYLTMAYLAQKLGFPVIVVSDGTLGTINAVVMSINVAKEHNLKIAGFIFSDQHNTLKNTECFCNNKALLCQNCVCKTIIKNNSETIMNITSVKFLGIVPYNYNFEKTDMLNLSPLLEWIT